MAQGGQGVAGARGGFSAALRRVRGAVSCRLAAVAFVCGGLTGCASAPTSPLVVEPPPLADALFGAPEEAVDVAQLFTLSQAMQDYLREHLGPPGRAADATSRLVAALNQGGGLQLRYDDSFTRTPAQAFAQRRGNCLSLAMMTAAFAQALGLAVDYQLVQAPDLLARDDDLVLRSSHVNVVFSRGLPHGRWQQPDRLAATVDFVPAEQLQGLAVQHLDQATVVALFLNNRAAESLRAGRLNQAYAWARAAVLQRPGLAPALNTLGVVFQRAAQPALADQALAQALRHQPLLVAALANRVPVLRALGRDDEAQASAELLARLEPEPPFQLLDQGRAALQRGEAELALRLFQRAARQLPDLPEAQFWLARAHHQLGQLAAAQQAMAQAVELSQRDAERSRYSAKLAWLRALPPPP